jgi:hypothetical protein
MDIKYLVKRITTRKQRLFMRALGNTAVKIYTVTIDAVKVYFNRKNLTFLARYYGTDKWGVHHYTPHYTAHFEPFRLKKINILEIGVGGYDKPNKGGASLRMWKKYFPRGQVYSVDIYDKAPLQEDRIRIFKGSQTDPVLWEKIFHEVPEFNLIIDDGSHINSDVIKTFRLLFPRLACGGIYVVEDTQSSYWPEFGGDSDNLENPNTAMYFFKKLADGLNYAELSDTRDSITDYDRQIVSIHFYHNIVFIYKGVNDEQSNKMEARRALTPK